MQSWTSKIYEIPHMILEQMVQRVIRAGQQVHEKHDGPKTAIQQGLHGHDLGEQDNWIPLCVPEARLHCVVYGIHCRLLRSKCTVFGQLF